MNLYPFFFGPRAGASAMVSGAEAALAELTPEAEENLRALFGTPSRDEIDALVERIRTATPEPPGVEEPESPVEPPFVQEPEPVGGDSEPGDDPPRGPRGPRGQWGPE